MASLEGVSIPMEALEPSLQGFHTLGSQNWEAVMSEGKHLQFTWRKQKTECRNFGANYILCKFLMDAFGRNRVVPDRLGTVPSMVHISAFSEKMGLS